MIEHIQFFKYIFIFIYFNLIFDFNCFFKNEVRNNLMAKNYSFYEVLNSNNESDPNIFNLRQRCLIPGLYYDHLSRWLKEFKYNQIETKLNTVQTRLREIYGIPVKPQQKKNYALQ